MRAVLLSMRLAWHLAVLATVALILVMMADPTLVSSLPRPVFLVGSLVWAAACLDLFVRLHLVRWLLDAKNDHPRLDGE